MRIWIDCEFNSHQGELISMALVDENSRHFYEVLRCENPQPWVAKHVIPVLGKSFIGPDLFKRKMEAWLRGYDSVHIVADWPADIAHFCQMLIASPHGERMVTPPLTMEIRRDLDAVSVIPHNALEDAIAIRYTHLRIENGAHP
jgi:hypothetical protein